jgi:hypothetical protein
MNFYDILAAEKWGGGIPTMNFFDLLFAQSMGGNIQWETYEGVLPATLDAKSANMRQYQIWGNVGGVGDRTVQLFDKDTALDGYKIISDGIQENENWCISDFIPVESNTLYKSQNSGGLVLSYTDKSSQPTRLGGTLNRNGVTTLSETKFIKTNCLISQKASCIVAKSDDLPETFVPFGYEVDMSTSDGTNATTTPIYIGDEPLDKINNYADYVDYKAQKIIRAIKKYVLTGDEGWEKNAGSTASRDYFRWVFAPMFYCVRHILRCSHFIQKSITTSTTNVGVDVFESSSVKGEVLAIRPANVQTTTLADFTAWLAEQYAAGTPVTVWCALTTAEETDPPVPLPALPTCEGTTIVDYAGSGTAPEKVYFEYQGGKQS